MTISPRSRVLLVIAVLLAAFGAYESVDAALGIGRVRGGPMGAIFHYPPWGLLHFIPGLLFMTLSPLQLWARFRNRHRTVHRWTGRVLVACGVFLGGSGLAFPFTMPERPVGEQVFMTLFGVAFLFVLVRAFAAARRRDYAAHRAWMIRFFVNGLTITTQRLYTGVLIVTLGANTVDQFWERFVLAGWLAFAIQVAVAEWWIRRTAPVRRSARPEAVATPA
jgi:uncharacterized membrane protein